MADHVIGSGFVRGFSNVRFTSESGGPLKKYLDFIHFVQSDPVIEKLVVESIQCILDAWVLYCGLNEIRSTKCADSEQD